MPLTRRHTTAALIGLTCPWLNAALHAAEGSASVDDEMWSDAARQREVPVKVRWPDARQHQAPYPVVLFSHGLGGTTDGGEVWGKAWAEAGFVVVHLQHPGSDLPAVRSMTDTFTDKAALRRAASPAQLLARLRDVIFALDEIGRRQAAGQTRWRDVRPDRVGMSGHSFGAHTTLGMAGQRYPGFEGVNEPRLAAFVAFSPSPPVAGSAGQAFSRLTRPLLSITGTLDSDVAGTGATPERRMAVFDALPVGHKAHLVLAHADHMTFGGQTGRAVEIISRTTVTRELQPVHHALVASVTTDWWRDTLAGDTSARARLASPGGLAAGDRWQRG